jgi:hypothetical protein
MRIHESGQAGASGLIRLMGRGNPGPRRRANFGGAYRLCKTGSVQSLPIPQPGLAATLVRHVWPQAR